MWAAPFHAQGPGLNVKQKGECELSTSVPFSLLSVCGRNVIYFFSLLCHGGLPSKTEG